MELIVETDGRVRCVYGEPIGLSVLGPLNIRRASHVEADERGRWVADLSPVNGPKLGPFANRTDALSAEVLWLSDNWLTPAR